MQSPPIPRPPDASTPPRPPESPGPRDDDERRERFEAMYREWQAPVLGYVLRRTSSPHDAADVIAETFLTAWRRLDDVPPGPEARLWLYGVARRTLANHHRGERRRSALTERIRADLSATWPPGPDSPDGACELDGVGELDGTSELDGASDLAGVAAAFRRLPGPQREVLALNVWEDLDYGQIAVVLGCSRNAVRIRLHRARRQFAAELTKPELTKPELTQSEPEAREGNR